MKTKLASGLFDWRAFKLTTQDYDFRQCSSWQREFCLQYETAREFVAIRDTVKRNRQKFGTSLKPWQAGAWQFDCQWPEFVSFTYWPDTPWQAVPPARQKQWIIEWQSVSDPSRLLSGGTRRFRGMVDSVSADNLRNEFGVYEDHAAAREGSATFHVLAVHWFYSNKELLADFALWLKNHRPPGAEPDDSRDHDAATLKTIGARRLLLAGGAKLALDNDLYSDQAAYLKAKAKADTYLKKRLPVR